MHRQHNNQSHPADGREATCGTQRTGRAGSRVICALGLGLLLVCGQMGRSAAQSVTAETSTEEFTRTLAANLPHNVGINDQRHAQVPLDIQLQDSSGAAVRFGELLNGKPVILTPVYFQCPMLCNMTMDGQLRALTELKLDAGRDFTVLTVSFDAREGSELAAGARRTALTRYARPGTEAGWRFLTGGETEVERLMQAIGFRYQYDQKTGRFAHAAGLVVLTPEGIVSHYLHGVEFAPRDLRLALVEASEGKVGSATDQILLLCFHYDPVNGKYGLAIMNLLRLGGVLTIVAMTMAIVIMMRKDRPASDSSSSFRTEA